MVRIRQPAKGDVGPKARNSGFPRAFINLLGQFAPVRYANLFHRLTITSWPQRNQEKYELNAGVKTSQSTTAHSQRARRKRSIKEFALIACRWTIQQRL